MSHEFDRPLPNSSEAERAVLGAVLLDNGLLNQAMDLLKPDDFYVPSHRRIYIAMIALFERGQEVNPILIGEVLNQESSLESVGGISMITNLTYGLPHSTNIRDYATVVKKKALLRQLIRTASRITNEALEEEDDALVILNSAQQAIFDLGSHSGERRVMSMKQITAKAADVVGAFVKGVNPGLPTPWPNLNNLCRGGIQESELWGLAALMKQGKSAWMKQWAQFLGTQGRRVLIFTREMSEIKILFRMLAALTDIPASQIRYGLDSNRVDMLLRAMKEMSDYPIFIDATTSNVNDFRARVREMIRLEGIEIVFGDYLQLFHSGLKKSDSRATEIGHVWRTMKDTAQDFNTRIVALAQFNREAFKSDKRPYFHQVEGSGEGEKAVDLGMVLWTDLNGGEPGARPATVNIDYQRDEDAGTYCELIFNGRIMEFHQPGEAPIQHPEKYLPSFND